MKRNSCPHCNFNEWRKEPIFKLINPNGEFVEGYGHDPVYITSGYKYICVNCGWLEGGNSTRINIDDYHKKHITNRLT